MIETALFFTLGFLCAVFVSILLLPIIIKVTYHRSRRDIEAKLPISMVEITAQSDGLRARYAAEIAGLEIRIRRSEEARAVLKIELGKNHQLLKTIPELEKSISTAQQTNQSLQDRLTTAYQLILQQKKETLEKEREFARLQQHNNDLNELKEITRLELIANETTNDNLHNQMTKLRRAQKDFDMHVTKLKAEIAAGKTALQNEQQKNVILEEKLARLIRLLSDAEEKLSRSASVPDTQQHKIREEIQDLAAEMAALTAKDEGQQSPIQQILMDNHAASALSSANEARRSSLNNKVSLAQRIDSLYRGR